MLSVEFTQAWKIGATTYTKGQVASLTDDVARSLMVSQVVQWPQRSPVQGQKLADPFPQYALSVELAKALARTPDALIIGTVTRDANGAATSAPVKWPDGTPGTYTALTVSTAFPGAVDSYKITYGSPVVRTTYTQPAVTRDASGAATSVPAIVVS